VRIALQRLNQAVRRHLAADKALELAIALETLLTDGPGQNTYKIGLRSALLRRGSVSEQLARRAVVSALYSVRSAVAHDGVAPSRVSVVGRGKIDSGTVVTESMTATTDVIATVIARGGVPDWYSFEIAPTVASPTDGS
jgi:hypothetical protein